MDSSLNAAVYYYQPAIFEERSLSVPTTWDEFMETGAQFWRKKASPCLT